MESGSGKADVLLGHLPSSASLFEELVWPSRGLHVAPILPSLLNLNYLWESSAGLTAKRLPPSGVSANLCDQQGKPRNHTDGADVCV